MLRVAFLICLFLISTAPTLSESETVEASEVSKPTKKKYFFPEGRDKKKNKKSYVIRQSQKSLEEQKKKMSSPERMAEHLRRLVRSRIGDYEEPSEKPKVWTREEHRAYIDGVKEEQKREAEEWRARLEEKERSRQEWREDFRARVDEQALNNRFMDRARLPTFDIRDSKENIISLDSDNFPDGRLFLIVNTASECEFSHQYSGLEELYQEYKDRGFRVVAFPSDSFHKEPATNEYIQSFVKEHYKVTFPVMGKCEVNGPNQPELFSYLKSVATRVPKIPNWAPLEKTNLWEKDIQWNFEKFLIWKVNGRDRVTRFPYDVPPMRIARDVQRALRRLDIISEGGRRKRKIEL